MAATQTGLERVVLSEGSQTRTERHLKRKDASELGKQKQTPRTLTAAVGKQGEGTVREPGMDTHTLLHLTRRTSKDLLDSTGVSAQYSVITLWSPGGRMGEGTVRESGMDMDTLLYFTWRTSKDLLDSTGDSAQSSVITLWSLEGRWGKG